MKVSIPSHNPKTLCARFFLLKKRWLTLVEIMIVMALISIVGGVLAFGIRQITREQCFRTEVSQVLNTLRLAQQIMLILNTDVHVVFKASPQGFTYRILLDDKLTERWHLELTKKRPPLTEIHAINFKDALNPNGNQTSIDIKFLSGGSTMSQGVLRLGVAPPGVPDTQEAFICLPGYPYYITDASSANDPSCNLADQKKFNQALTQAIVSEITEKKKTFQDIQEEENNEDSGNAPKNKDTSKNTDKKDGQATPKKN